MGNTIDVRYNTANWRQIKRSHLKMKALQVWYQNYRNGENSDFTKGVVFQNAQ